MQTQFASGILIVLHSPVILVMYLFSSYRKGFCSLVCYCTAPCNYVRLLLIGIVVFGCAECWLGQIAQIPMPPVDSILPQQGACASVELAPRGSIETACAGAYPDIFW